MFDRKNIPIPISLKFANIVHLLTHHHHHPTDDTPDNFSLLLLNGDLQQQKALTGKFMISAPRNKDLIASAAKLREENKSLLN